MSKVIELPRPRGEAEFIADLMSAGKEIAAVVVSLQATIEPAPMLGALLTVFGTAAIAAGLSREQTLGFLQAYGSEVFDNWDGLQADFAQGKLLVRTPEGVEHV